MSRHGGDDGGGGGGDGGDGAVDQALTILYPMYKDAKHVAANQTATFDPPIDAFFVKVAASQAVVLTIGDGTFSYPAASLAALTIVQNIGPISGIAEGGTGTMTYVALRENKHVTADTIS